MLGSCWYELNGTVNVTMPVWYQPSTPEALPRLRHRLGLPHRSCGLGKLGTTCAANSRIDFCASPRSSVPKFTCSEACSNLPMAPVTRWMMALISSGVPTQAPPDFDLALERERAQLRIDVS